MIRFTSHPKLRSSALQVHLEIRHAVGQDATDGDQGTASGPFLSLYVPFCCTPMAWRSGLWAVFPFRVRVRVGIGVRVRVRICLWVGLAVKW
jgi:hypothetical protein